MTALLSRAELARLQAAAEARRTVEALRKDGSVARRVYAELTGMGTTWASWRHVEGVIAAIEYARLMQTLDREAA